MHLNVGANSTGCSLYVVVLCFQQHAALNMHKELPGRCVVFYNSFPRAPLRHNGLLLDEQILYVL